MVSFIQTTVTSNKIGFRALRFCIVGGTGALILMGITFFLTEVAGLYYMFSTAIAILVASTWNFTAHGFFTYGVYKWKK